jgi:hypothetical protein
MAGFDQLRQSVGLTLLYAYTVKCSLPEVGEQRKIIDYGLRALLGMGGHDTWYFIGCDNGTIIIT